MTFLKKHWQIAATLVLIAFMFFFGWRLNSQSVRAIDLALFILLGVGLLVLVPFAGVGDEILRKLKEQATSMKYDATRTVDSVSWPSPRTHRQELELALAGRMGDLPLNDPQQAGKNVKQMLDALLTQDGPPMPSPDEQVAERALRQVLAIVQRYLPPDGISIDEAMGQIIALVDPFPVRSSGAVAEQSAAASDALLSSAGYAHASCGGCKKVETIKLPVVDTGPDALERAIQAKGLTAPRVTMDEIQAEITHEHYFTAEQGARHPDAVNPRDYANITSSLSRLTFCVLKLKNGFTVTGESACVSPENFDAKIGRDIARANAIEKMWLLLGFRLADKLTTNS